MLLFGFKNNVVLFALQNKINGHISVLLSVWYDCGVLYLNHQRIIEL
jgi:hypothetical protein